MICCIKKCVNLTNWCLLFIVGTIYIYGKFFSIFLLYRWHHGWTIMRLWHLSRGCMFDIQKARNKNLKLVVERWCCVHRNFEKFLLPLGNNAFSRMWPLAIRHSTFYIFAIVAFVFSKWFVVIQVVFRCFHHRRDCRSGLCDLMYAFFRKLFPWVVVDVYMDIAHVVLRRRVWCVVIHFCSGPMVVISIYVPCSSVVSPVDVHNPSVAAIHHQPLEGIVVSVIGYRSHWVLFFSFVFIW